MPVITALRRSKQKTVPSSPTLTITARPYQKKKDRLLYMELKICQGLLVRRTNALCRSYSPTYLEIKMKNCI